MEGKYDTRMRIYRQERTGDTVVVFRFTVQPTGEVIHTNRYVYMCVRVHVCTCVGRPSASQTGPCVLM